MVCSALYMINKGFKISDNVKKHHRKMNINIGGSLKGKGFWSYWCNMVEKYSITEKMSKGVVYKGL